MKWQNNHQSLGEKRHKSTQGINQAIEIHSISFAGLRKRERKKCQRYYELFFLEMACDSITIKNNSESASPVFFSSETFQRPH